MARSKSHKDDENLRGEIRELKAQNKALKKRLRQLEKNKHIWEEYLVEEEDRSERKQNKQDMCPECGDGTLVYVDLGIKHLFSCSVCTYRTKAKDKE